jgi:hypothetical protein
MTNKINVINHFNPEQTEELEKALHSATILTMMLFATAETDSTEKINKFAKRTVDFNVAAVKVFLDKCDLMLVKRTKNDTTKSN